MSVRDTWPPPLMTSEPDSFALFTMLERLPKIAGQALSSNGHSATVGSNIAVLQDELVHGLVKPVTEIARDVEHWNAHWSEYEGRTWLDIPFYFAEAYFYRRLLEATGYLQPGLSQGLDPFGYRKRAQEKTAIRYLAQSWDQLVESPANSSSPDCESLKQRLRTLLHSSLWANRADLSYDAVADRVKGGLSIDSEPNNLLLDDTDALIERFVFGLQRLDIICDNAGIELLYDLALVRFLLGEGLVQKVILHLKDRPFFVSDSMPSDVFALFDEMKSSGHSGVQAMAQDLKQLLASERLLLRTDSAPQAQRMPFWTSAHDYGEIPSDLRVDLEGADLILLKGDANYRRLLGDRRWPHTTILQDVTGHFPGPFATLRTLKSEIMVNLEPGRASELTAEDPDWLFNGQRGLIQYVAPTSSAEENK
jgi:uncharacterized protein with ATP-grasp and redox domains